MATRKLFRMKYESCNGRCYEYDDVLRMHSFDLDVTQATILLDRIITIHEPACGNANLAYGLDVGEEPDAPNIFVASFIHYGATDLFVDTSALGALNQLIDFALAWYASDEGKQLIGAQPGLGHTVCEHGEDYDLRRFALRFSGLSEQDQAAVLSAA